MATSIQFDLNTAFRNWRERLRQSPHFRTENLDELESHLRDSVCVLQSQGLTADEAFMIGARRVGTADALEDQFAEENGGTGWRNAVARFIHNHKNRALHALILFYFTVGNWLLWGCLKVSQSMAATSAKANLIEHVENGDIPGFTKLFWSLMPYWFVLPAIMAIYCGFVWTRKRKANSWVGFFSVTTAILFLLLVPTLIAAELPIIAYLGHFSLITR